MEEMFGGEMAHVPYVMPSFDLASTAAACFRDRSEATGMLLGKHGHFTWGPYARKSYDQVIEQTNMVKEWLVDKGQAVIFMGKNLPAALTGKFLSQQCAFSA